MPADDFGTARVRRYLAAREHDFEAEHLLAHRAVLAAR
jgi:hypothetical protein